MSLGGGASTTLKNAVDYAWKGGAANGARAGRRGRQRRRRDAQLPGRLPERGLGRGDRQPRPAGELLERERGRRGRRARGRHHVDLERRRLQHDLGHVDGDPARRRRHRADPRRATRRATAAQIVAKLDGAVDDLGPAGRDPSFGFGRVNLLQAATE